MHQNISILSRGSLQQRLALIAGGLALLLSVIFLVIVSHAYRDRIIQGHERAGMQVNRLLQSALENAMLKRDIPGLQEIVADLGAQPGINGVQIVNPQGEVRFSSYAAGLNAPLGDPALHTALRSQTPVSAFRELPGGMPVLRSINPVRNRTACRECHGDAADSPVNGLLVVDYEATGLRRQIVQGSLWLGALGAVVVLAVIGAMWVALRQMVLAPLDKLHRTATALAGGDLNRRAALSGATELTETGRAFDSMANQLQANISALDEQRGLLQKLIDAIPDGVRVIGPDYRILMSNDAYARQLGQDGPVVGQPCHLSSHARKTPCVPTLVTCPVVELLEKGADPARLKCSQTHTTASGSALPVEVQAARAMIPVEGHPTAVIIESIRDLDAQVAISQEQRLAEMGMLAAGVAHEVYNPLSSIRLVLDSLENEPCLGPKAREYLTIAQSEIASCQKVTESLLKLASPAGDHNAPPPLTDAVAVLDDTAHLLAREAEQAGVRILVDCPAGTTARVADSDLRMLCFNLTQNAIHAMPDGGTVTLRAREDANGTTLEVSDTGIGIALGDQARVMLPFWTRRADGSSGRGLGLAICAAILRSLNGTIDLDSTPGRGTRFSIWLPAAPSDARAEP